MRAGADLDSKALREAREARGLTQHQLARLIGVAGGERIARWERGASRPMPRLVHAMAEALEVSVGFLLAEERAGLTLRDLRVRSGLTAEQVAKMSLMSADTYRHWEAGYLRGAAPYEAVLRIAASLNVPVDDVEGALNRVERPFPVSYPQDISPTVDKSDIVLD